MSNLDLGDIKFYNGLEDTELRDYGSERSVWAIQYQDRLKNSLRAFMLSDLEKMLEEAYQQGYDEGWDDGNLDARENADE
jgi:hypothetical protein